jgi:hypothetical protein
MPLSGDPVPTRLDPLGVEGAHRVISGLHCGLGVSEVELALPVRSLGGSKRLRCSSQLAKCFLSNVGRWTGNIVLS